MPRLLRKNLRSIAKNRDHSTQIRNTQLGCMTFFLAHIVVLAWGVVSFALTPEGEALLVFKAGVRDTRGVLDSWRPMDMDPCQWKGVACDRHKHVIRLNLPYSHLWGSISPALGKLEQLRRLSLHENNLFGELPAELGNCNKLKALYLHDNFLSGHIPAQLGSLSNLMILDISGNSLTGTIPPSLGNLKKLKHLNISTNFLVGKIPQTGVLASFSSQSFLGNLDLCGDQIATICKSEVSGPSVIKEPNVSNSKTNNGEAPSSYVNSLLIGAMATMGVSFTLVVMCFWGYLLYNRAAIKDEITKPVVLEEPKIKVNVFHGDLPYTSQSIMKKIELLDDADIIGSGGFGTVYKLAMDESNVFAIKRIEKNGKFCERIFERELEILGILRHRNLVNLRGYCNANSMNLLIYDFLANGNLESLLYGSPEVTPLTWADRMKIAIGTAKGLSYLHHDCCPTILHRDIKSSNILLDENLEPHLADFGLAKLMEETEAHVTTVLAGTFGYLAPEYMQSGRASTKTDVYSYGVLLLELISGRRPTEISFVEKGLNLVGWVELMIKDQKQREILDCRCCQGETNEGLEAMLSIAVACVSARPEGRPPMNKIVQLLEVETMSPCPSDFYDSCSD